MPCKDSSKNLLDPSLLHCEGSNGATTENRGVRSAAHRTESFLAPRAAKSKSRSVPSRRSVGTGEQSTTSAPMEGHVPSERKFNRNRFTFPVNSFGSCNPELPRATRNRLAERSP
ncbi:hypothetical protein pipiens_016628 [Culex pipiens pipiens]|uniref:Uncharacterized protein n=1 Tax=Culex pipiens pipiens TaxID=38569 RepID=A0ABD1CKF7_CULPP